MNDIDDKSTAPVTQGTAGAPRQEARPAEGAVKDAAHPPEPIPTDAKEVTPDDAPPAPEPEVPSAEVADPASPPRRAASWRNLPAEKDWCPPELIDSDGLGQHRYQDDESLCAADAAALWNAFGVSRRGRSHANNGTHREDAMAFMAGERFAAAIVSDGAGSSRHSRVGSHVACTRGVEVLRRELMALSDDLDEQVLASQLNQIVVGLVQGLCDRLHELAATARAERRDFYCTYLVALAIKTRHAELMAFTQVGDGFILVERNDGDIVEPCEADSGALAGEVSCFLPMASAPAVAAQKLRFFRAESVRRVLLASDGIADPFYPALKKAPLIFEQLDRGVAAPAEGFKQALHGPVFGHESPQENLHAWMGFEVRGENDDRTLLAMHRPLRS